MEPLRFLGCLIERIPSGQIIMHQRSYIDHCLKSNDMEKLKGLTTLPAVDERSPPEEEVDENGQATDYEEHKSACQKHIGQFMWLATRTRPDISATLGILASQMVIRPKYVHGCLKQLWRYIVGTRELDMTSFEPNDVAFGELLLTLYVDASFSTGGGRSRTGIAMYLVNPIDGSESRADLRIQVCYHPVFSPKLVSIQEDREIIHTPVGISDDIKCVRKNEREGSRQSGDECPQMTQQERKQYEWYMKKYQNADMTRDPDGERERISMIIAALFPHCSHMPPERTEKKQGRKKGLQGETPGESRDDIKARTAAQKLEQQQQRAKAIGGTT